MRSCRARQVSITGGRVHHNEMAEIVRLNNPFAYVEEVLSYRMVLGQGPAMRSFRDILTEYLDPLAANTYQSCVGSGI